MQAAPTKHSSLVSAPPGTSFWIKTLSSIPTLSPPPGAFPALVMGMPFSLALYLSGQKKKKKKIVTLISSV